jgi:hypothetical protein
MIHAMVNLLFTCHHRRTTRLILLVNSPLVNCKSPVLGAASGSVMMNTTDPAGQFTAGEL